LAGAQFSGCPDWEVSGCTDDSRRLDPGQVFVAVRGEHHDGHEFVAQALERGAAGVVVERPCPEAGRLQVVVPNTRAAHARLCQALAGDPSENLLTVGVTGSCGKTATALFLRAILEAAGGRFGLVGKLGWSDGVAIRPVGASASEAEGLAAMLGEMVDRGCAGAVLELDREALGRRRIEGISFDFAVVTDIGGAPALTSDELIARRNAKARLFRQLVPGGAAIVNADDPQAELLGAVNLDARRVSFGIKNEADVTAKIERLDHSGSRIILRGFGREVGVTLRTPGASVVSHALAAAAVAWARGVDVRAVVEGLESVATIPGRLEAVEEGQAFDVRIDQARQGVEIQDALLSLRAITPGKIHCVVGAEGNRDRRERRSVAKVAEAFAERVTLTTDNPRTEDLNQVFDDLIAGLQRPGRVRIELDRQQAIETALAEAQPGDAVLIAGKGRQTFQILADRAVPFDDAEIARQWLKSHRFGTKRSA
jgi:UDP-N-acetylmuramoyl-L-alanyl-D-glutamate--2,6-diaminopimelate ligase